VIVGRDDAWEELMNPFSLDDLAAIIAARAGSATAASYTKSLLASGAAGCARKFGEEAIEFVVATVDGDRGAIVNESADVLYHMLVALQLRGVPLSDVLCELERRTGQSGLQEKASRQAAG
jgi:phosphoribosyl-ATP pyrophosphohydrolase